MDRYLPPLKRHVSESLAKASQIPPLRNLLDRYSIDSDQLRSDAESRGRIWEYGSHGKFAFHTPIHHQEIPPEIQQKIGEFEIETGFVTELHDVDLVGPHPVAITADGDFVLEHALRSRSLLLRGLVASLKNGVKPIRHSRGDSIPKLDTVVPLTGPWTRGFFHWFSEWLPRIEGVMRYQSATGRSPTLLLPAKPPEWMVSSLRLLGYQEEDLMSWNGGRVNVERMVLPSLRRARAVDEKSQGYVIPPDSYEWVREQLLSEVLDLGTGQSRRILITRKDADERRLMNVDEVTRVVDDLEPMTLSDLSLERQIRLFSDAELVIGPHGAGLTNLIYSKRPTVIEAFGDYINACYFTLSDGLEHTYAFTRTAPEGPDISIPPDSIRALLEQADL